MNEMETIINNLKKTFEGRAWHGPSLLETLDSLDAGEARCRPIGGRHTILEIVNHCAYWMDAVVDSLKGKEMPKIEHGSVLDWPRMKEKDEEWIDAQENINESYKELLKAIIKSDVTLLDDIVPGRKYAYREVLQGISDHNIYHAGQIAVFKMNK